MPKNSKMPDLITWLPVREPVDRPGARSASAGRAPGRFPAPLSFRLWLSDLEFDLEPVLAVDVFFCAAAIRVPRFTMIQLLAFFSFFPPAENPANTLKRIGIFEWYYYTAPVPSENRNRRQYSPAS